MAEEHKEEHKNVSLLKRLDPCNLSAAADVYAQDVVFHYFNPELSDIQGDYAGLTGIRTFFETLGAKSDGTFKAHPVSTTAMGDELVVTHTRNTMTLQGRPITTDAVVVWRIVDGRIAEIWDIPSVFGASTQGGGDDAA